MSKTPKHDPAGSRERVGDRITIYPRGKNGIYSADFWLDGEHRRKSLGTRTKRIALKRAVALEQKLQQGNMPARPSKILITEARDRYLAWLKAEDRARKTLVRYRGELTALAEFMDSQGIKQLSRITLTAYDRFRHQRAVNHKPKTMYHEGVVAIQFLKWCVSRNLLTVSPLTGYRLNKPPRVSKVVPTVAEVRRILAECSPATRERLSILACTGMRPGELQGLSKCAVDLSSGFIRITRQVGGPTKTRDSRKIPIHAAISPCLKRLLAADDHGLLITAEPSRRHRDGGHHIDTKKLNERFKAAMKRAGLAGFTLYSLRAVFNTHCIHSGIPERAVRSWMGHRDRSMTGIYYDLGDEESKRFMKKVCFDGLGAPRPAASPAA